MNAVEAEVVRAFSDIEDLSRAYAPGDRFNGPPERVQSLSERGFVTTGKPPEAAAAEED